MKKIPNWLISIISGAITALITFSFSWGSLNQKLNTEIKLREEFEEEAKREINDNKSQLMDLSKVSAVGDQRLTTIETTVLRIEEKIDGKLSGGK